jgi:hypothetical protein
MATAAPTASPVQPAITTRPEWPPAVPSSSTAAFAISRLQRSSLQRSIVDKQKEIDELRLAMGRLKDDEEDDIQSDVQRVLSVAKLSKQPEPPCEQSSSEGELRVIIKGLEQKKEEASNEPSREIDQLRDENDGLRKELSDLRRQLGHTKATQASEATAHAYEMSLLQEKLKVEMKHVRNLERSLGQLGVNTPEPPPGKLRLDRERKQLRQEVEELRYKLEKIGDRSQRAGGQNSQS